MNKLIAIFTIVVFITLALSTLSYAQTPEELIEIRNAYAAAMDAHDLDAMMSYWVDDCTYDLVRNPPPGKGKDAIRAGFEQMFAAFPDFHTDEGIVLAAGNIVVVAHNSKGTHAGTGNSMTGPHLDIYEFEGDKIKKATTYGDDMIQMIQLGFLPAPDMPDLVPSVEIPDPEPTGLSPMEADAESIARWNSHDIAEIAKMSHSDFKMFAGTLGIFLNRVEMAAMNEIFFKAFPDIRIEEVRRIDLGDGWVLLEEVSKGTHKGEFLGIPASGYFCENRVVLLTHYDENGLTTEQYMYYDNMTNVEQMTTAPYTLDGIWVTSSPTPLGNFITKTLYTAQDDARTMYSGTLEALTAFPLLAELYPDADPALFFSAGGQAVMTGRNKYEATYLSYDRKIDEASGSLVVVGLNTLKAYFEVTGPDQIQGQGSASYYMAAQDADQDGFPDEGEEPVLCVPWEWTSKKLGLMPECVPVP